MRILKSTHITHNKDVSAAPPGSIPVETRIEGPEKCVLAPDLAGYLEHVARAGPCHVRHDSCAESTEADKRPYGRGHSRKISGISSPPLEGLCSDAYSQDATSPAYSGQKLLLHPTGHVHTVPAQLQCLLSHTSLQVYWNK